MIRRSFRFGLLLGLLGGAAFALNKVLGSRSDSDARSATAPSAPWPRLVNDPAAPAEASGPAPAATPTEVPFVPDPAAPSPVAPVAEEAVVTPEPPTATPAPAKKAPAKKKPLAAAWVEPTGGVCPTSHPVKAKLTSKIFHLPGMLNYERTSPDRCYADATKAEADGLRPAKR